jgi:protein TonB
MQENALFAEVCFAQTSLVKRLANEFREAAHDLRADPKAYIVSAFRGDASSGGRRKALLQFGFALSLVLYTILFAVMLILWSFQARPPIAQRDYTVIPIPSSVPPDLELPKADKDPHGGGGGGNHEMTPASDGERPPFDLTPAVIAPTTKPTPQPPTLPAMETLLGDPSHNIKHEEAIPTGLPDGVPGPPSDGPGAGRGVGGGKGGGVGPGNGRGFGPGEEAGEGGDKYSPGGRRSVDASPVVDIKPIPLNQPRPNYTEEARQNKVQGIVRAQILIGSDGLVKQVRIQRGLPYGLNEEAIRAASQMRFRPAIKNGVAVAFWTALDVEFNLR